MGKELARGVKETLKRKLEGKGDEEFAKEKGKLEQAD